MHAAVRSRRVKAMQWLKEQGLDVNAKDDEGVTLMHCAARMDEVDMLTWLKESGADVNAKDNEGKTPLQCALQSAKEEEDRENAVAGLKANGAE